jgi:hypothetical protein
MIQTTRKAGNAKPAEDCRQHLLRRLFVDAPTYRRQHASDLDLSPTCQREAICAFHDRYEAGFPGCYITSNDPRHWNRSRTPKFSAKGFTLYHNHKRVFSHPSLKACRNKLLQLIAHEQYQGDYRLFLADIRNRFPKHPRTQEAAEEFTFEHWWQTCRDNRRKAKYGRKVLSGGLNYDHFLAQLTIDESCLGIDKVLRFTLEPFLIGTLWARGRRVIYLADPRSLERIDTPVMPGPDLVSPEYDQHDQVLVVEFAPETYQDERYGPSFVLLHLAADRKRLIAAAHLAHSPAWYWSVFERETAGGCYHRRHSLCLGNVTSSSDPTESVRALQACENGIRQAMQEAHFFLRRRVELLDEEEPAPLQEPHRVRVLANGEPTDHIAQTIRWVKDPLPVQLRQPRRRQNDTNRTVRPHERQRHYRRQRYGKDRKLVRVIEVPATIVHPELFTGHSGNIDIRIVKREGGTRRRTLAPCTAA